MQPLGWIVIGLLALVFIMVFFGSFFTVDTAQVAVITRFGKFLRVAEPGLNWKWPFMHAPAAVRDISDQVMQSMLVAERAKAQ